MSFKHLKDTNPGLYQKKLDEARERARKHRQTKKYRRWLEDTRDRRLKYKQQKRLELGAIPRPQARGGRTDIYERARKLELFALELGVCTATVRKYKKLGMPYHSVSAAVLWHSQQHPNKTAGAKRFAWNGMYFDSEAELYRYRYRNDMEFREKERERTKRTKRSCPLWYANYLLGGTSKHRYPEELLQVKRIHKLISNELGEKFTKTIDEEFCE